jgi:hypothetical protein
VKFLFLDVVVVPMVVSEAETEGEDADAMAVEDEKVGDLIFRTDEEVMVGEEEEVRDATFRTDEEVVVMVEEQEVGDATFRTDEEVMVEAEVVREVTFRKRTNDSVSKILNGALTLITITTNRGKDMVGTMKATMIAAGVADTVGAMGEDMVEVAMEVVAVISRKDREHHQVAREKPPANRGKDTVDTTKAIMLATGMVDTVVGVAEEGVVEVAVEVVVVVAPRKENRKHRQLARVKQPSLLKVILLRLLPQRLAEITVAVDSEDGEGAVVVDAASTELKLQP